MDSKKKIIEEIPVIDANFEYIAKTGHINGSLLIGIDKALDVHARNCMIEIIKYLLPNAKNVEDVVDGFLSSEYFKDLQK